MSGQHHSYQSHSWLFSYPSMELNCVIALVSRCTLGTQCHREQRGILWIWHLQKPHSCKIFFCQCVRLLWWWEAGSGRTEHVQWWCNQTCKVSEMWQCFKSKEKLDFIPTMHLNWDANPNKHTHNTMRNASLTDWRQLVAPPPEPSVVLKNWSNIAYMSCWCNWICTH